MSSPEKGYNINQTFIIETNEDGGVLSACTALFTTNIYACSGNTQILMGNTSIDMVGDVFVNGDLSATTISATTYYGDGSNLTGITTQDTFVTGGTYNNGTTVFTNNTGGTFSVSGFSTGYTLTSSAITSTLGYVPLSSYTDTFVTGGTYNNGTAVFTNNTGGTFSVSGFSTSNATEFTGGTVTGQTVFTNGLTANTISATTYQNLPLDIHVTGFTFNNGNYNITINQNDGTSYTQSLSTLASDVTITGGTYDPVTGVATFVNNTGGTFSVTGFLTGYTDTTISAFTYDNANTFKIDSTNGESFSATINSVTGLTVNGSLSANTYLGLPIDVRVTGGTYTNGTATFTNNTGGTFNVTGFSIGGGGGQLFYLNLSESKNGNRYLSATASTASEQSTGVTINNGATGTIASFQSDALGITIIPGGIWSFYLHSYKEDNNAKFEIFVEVYKLSSGGTSTLLFTTDPTDVTTNSPIPSMQLTDVYFSGSPIVVTDSIISVVKARNTGNQPKIITLVSEGLQHYSYVVSTLPTQQALTCETLSGCSTIQTIQSNLNNKLDKSGGTITNNLVINGNLSATTISATTYQNLPTDVFTTGATYNNGIAVFTNNTGGTFSVTGFYTGATDIFTTGATYNNANQFTFTNNTGATFNVNFNTVTGWTVNGDLTVTGNTFLQGLTAATIGNSGSCVTDLYVTNIRTCSPLNIVPNNEGDVFFGNNSGLTYNVANSRLGIGNSNPDHKLDIIVDNQSNGNIRFTRYGAGPNLIYRTALGSLASPTIITNGTGLGSTLISGYDGTAFSTTYGNLVTLASENWSTTGNGFGTQIRTVQNGTTTATIRQFITNNGFVGIGSSTPSAKLNVNGNISTIASLGTGGIISRFEATQVTDTVAAANSTNAAAYMNVFAQSTINAANTAVTYSNAANVFIAGDPVAGSGVTLTNSVGLWNTGTSRLDGNVGIGSIFNSNIRLSVTPSSTSTNLALGTAFRIVGTTVTDTTNTGTISNPTYALISVPTFASTNSTTANLASTLTIAGDPIQGSNMTILQLYGLYNAGRTRLDSNVGMGGNAGTNTRLQITLPTSTSAFTTNAAGFRVVGSTTTDSTSTGTVVNTYINRLDTLALASTNTGVTYTNVANLYIAGDITAGTNASITNSYGLWNAGKTRLDGNVSIGGWNGTGRLDVLAPGTTSSDIGIRLRNQGNTSDLFRVNGDGSSSLSGTFTAPTISATTYQNLPTDVFVTGGTFSVNSMTFRNNTGGTFSVTGITASAPSGIFGISDTSGVYTFYSTLSAAMTASVSGQTIEMFADITESGSTSVTLKAGVSLNGNGHTYTFTPTTTNVFTFVDSGATNFNFYNITIRRLGSQTGGCIIGTSNASTIINGFSTYLIVDTPSAFGITNSGGSVFAGTISGFDVRSNIASSQAVNLIRGTITNCRFISNSTTGTVGLNLTTITDSYIQCTSSGYALSLTNTATAYRLTCLSNTGNAVIGALASTNISNSYIYSSGSIAANNVNIRNSTILSDGSRAVNTCTLFNCTVASTSEYGAFVQNTTISNSVISSTVNTAVYLFDAANIYLSYITTSSANPALIFNNNSLISKAKNCTILNTSNNAAAHGIRFNFVSASTIDCQIQVTNSSANCLFAASAMNVRYKGCSFEGTTTPVNANVIQVITNTQDNQGNITIN